jgi:hypothetical protein
MKDKLGSNLAFLDMLFNMVMAFALLFLLSFLLIRPPAKSSDPAVEMKAEFIIQMAWPDGSLDDQDLWLLLPDGRKVGYSNKDLGIATLDRDDRGGIGNTYIDPVTGEEKIQTTHREIMTIRARLVGRYVVNVHTFSSRADYKNFQSQAQMPYDVKVTLTKLNPRVEQLVEVSVPVEKQNDQKTAFAFTVDEDGKVISVETKIDEPFINVLGPVIQ